jgi:hypothetical protein
MTDAPGELQLPAILARALAPVVQHPVPAWVRRLAAQVRNPDDPEASVRVVHGAVRGGRMMLERATCVAVQEIATGLGLPQPPLVGTLLEAAARYRLPIITGWDVSAVEPVYKVYANATDASDDARTALGAVVGLPPSGAPDLVGLNVPRDRAPEVKAYYQRPSVSAIGDLLEALGAERGRAALDGVAAEFRRYARALAWVLSCDVRGTEAPVPRALFVAASASDEGGAAELVEALTGTAWSRLRDAFPFPPGPIRQVGVSLRTHSADPTRGSVTVYCKRAGTAAPLHALFPLAVFVGPSGEVGVYVTPSESTPRAYTRTATHALSFRTRAGAPDRVALAALAAWLAAELRVAEAHATPPEALALDRPPAPWRRVDR